MIRFLGRNSFLEMAFALLVIFYSGPLSPQNISASEEIKVALAFHGDGGEDRQFSVTRDSLGILPFDSTAGSLEPDDESDFSDSKNKIGFSPAEKELVNTLFKLSDNWRGLKKYSCEKAEGYAFSLWSDSLSLHCTNCFSCTEGMTLQEAKILARFGKLAIWLYHRNEEQQ